MNIFVSYSHRDSKYKENVVNAINVKAGYCAVCDDEFLCGGQDFFSKIYSEIVTSQCIVVLLTDNYLESKFCLAEAEEAKNAGIPIIALSFGIVSVRMRAFIKEYSSENDHINIKSTSEVNDVTLIKKIDETSEENRKKVRGNLNLESSVTSRLSEKEVELIPNVKIKKLQYEEKKRTISDKNNGLLIIVILNSIVYLLVIEALTSTRILSSIVGSDDLIFVADRFGSVEENSKKLLVYGVALFVINAVVSLLCRLIANAVSKKLKVDYKDSRIIEALCYGNIAAILPLFTIVLAMNTTGDSYSFITVVMFWAIICADIYAGYKYWYCRDLIYGTESADTPVRNAVSKVHKFLFIGAIYFVGIAVFIHIVFGTLMSCLLV